LNEVTSEKKKLSKVLTDSNLVTCWMRKEAREEGTDKGDRVETNLSTLFSISS
jgi:hypothetical protein